MQKRAALLFIVLVLALLPLALAAENSTNSTNSTAADVESTASEEIEASTEDPTATLPEAGITPDSNFYFIEDSILSKFRSDLSNVERKAAEIKEMIEQGKIDEARIALARFNEYADRLETEIDPEHEEEAARIAAAIRNEISRLQVNIPQEAREEFQAVVGRSDEIKTAAEIAGKIKELCQTLSSLDPLQYEQTCKTNDDAPQWQKELDKELTAEQKKEAEAFFKTMSSCMRDPANCQCNEISVKSFADACSEIAPLIAKCEQQGDEEACRQVEEMPDPVDLLPEHLQAVMEQLENRYNDDRMDRFMPPECKEAGATTPKACMEVMFRANAPEECIAAVDSGDIDLSNERKAREQCERIMYESNAPQECIDAGLTGERQSDHKKCREIMESLGQEGRGEGPNRGPGPGYECQRIQDSEERLDCFDNALKNTREGGYGPRDGMGYGDPGRQGEIDDGRSFPEQCREAKALTPESCRKVMEEYSEKMYGQRRYEQPPQNQYQQGQPGQYVPSSEEQNPDNPYAGQPYSGQDQQPPTESSSGETPSGADSSLDSGSSSSSTDSSSSSTSDGSSSEGSDSSSSSSSSTSSDSSSSSSSSSSEPSSSGTTGGVIIFDSENKFLNYRYQ